MIRLIVVVFDMSFFSLCCIVFAICIVLFLVIQEGIIATEHPRPDHIAFVVVLVFVLFFFLLMLCKVMYDNFTQEKRKKRIIYVSNYSLEEPLVVNAHPQPLTKKVEP